MGGILQQQTHKQHCLQKTTSKVIASPMRNPFTNELAHLRVFESKPARFKQDQGKGVPQLSHLDLKQSGWLL